MNDLTFAVRQLLTKPGFTAVAVVTLALGIDANTAIFSVVNAVLLRPLPYPDSERLVWLSERSPNFPVMSISYPNFTDWRAQQTVFEQLGVYNWGSYNLTGAGFSHERVLSFRLDLPERKYETETQQYAFFQNLLENLRVLPGVQAVGISSQFPLCQDGWQTSFLIDGRPEPAPGERPSMEVTVASPDYFQTMGIPLLRGRYFNEQDNREHLRGQDQGGLTEGQRWVSGLNVIIVDREFAQRYWPNENPIGQHVRLPWGRDNEHPVFTIVGVVERVKLQRLNERGGFVQAYLSAAQATGRGRAVVVKTTVDPETIVTAVRQRVLALDAEQPIYNLRTLEALRYE